MTLDSSYLDYARRRYGMDHDRYEWSMLTDRRPVSWPDGRHLALWINVSMQYFPLNQEGKPFPPAGGMTTAYPDLRHYTLREYGNRVGIYRLLEAFDRFGIRPTFAFNARLARRYPYLLERIVDRGDELICHGWDMDSPHYGGMDEQAETDIVAQSLETLGSLSGKTIRGWLSPGKSQSSRTPELLVQHGIRYMCDWINDDMPYQFRTDAGEITAMPLSTELEDRFVLMANLHSEAEYADQVIDAFEFLHREAEQEGGRLLALNIHPWLLGQPHRIGFFERILAHITEHDTVWIAPSGEIRDAWLGQQDPSRQTRDPAR